MKIRHFCHFVTLHPPIVTFFYYNRHKILEHSFPNFPKNVTSFMDDPLVEVFLANLFQQLHVHRIMYAAMGEPVRKMQKLIRLIYCS